MAKFNEILTGRHNKLLTRLFSMKGPAPAPQLAGEIQPSLQIFHGAENRFLESWNRYYGFFQVGAVAAQNNAWALRNPANSNMIVVMEKLNLLDATNAQSFNFSITRNGVSGDLTNVFFGVSADSRNVANSVAVPSSANNVAVGALNFWRYTVLLNVNLEIINTHDQEIVLLPGDRLLVTSITVNTISVANIMWRERSLEESELRQ